MNPTPSEIRPGIGPSGPGKILTLLLLLAGLHLGATAAAAQKTERPDREAAAAARALADRRASADDIASAMQSRYRQSPGQTSAILRSLRMEAVTTGSAVAGVYRLRGEQVVSALVSGGFATDRVARDGSRLRLGTAELARGFKAVGVSTRDIAETFQKAGTAAEETAGGLRVVGAPLRETAAVLVDGYGLREPLRMREVLTAAGYSAEAPTVQNYSIAHYRKPGTSTRLPNVGIVDPERVIGPGSPSDGIVVIEGSGLDVPGLGVVIEHARGTTVGEVLRADDDELEVRFSDFGSGDLVVETAGGSSSTPVTALSYADRTVDQVFSPKPSFIFGGNQALMAWGFAPGSASTPDFSPPPDVTTTVTGTDDAPVLTVTSSPGQDLILEAAFNVQVTVNGSMIPRIDCWTCGDFKIRHAECSTLTYDCIVSNLAEAASSLFECANPANWRRDVVPFGSVPLVGAGFASLTYRVNVNTLPGGQLMGTAAEPEYQGGVWSPIPTPSYVSMTTVTGWWQTSVVPALLGFNAPFADAVAERLDSFTLYLPGADPRADLIGVHGLPNGSVRLAFSH